MSSTATETYSGHMLDLAKPDPGQVSIDDIAWHLSRIARWGGATTSDIVYTVAQHSVLVLSKVKQLDPEAGKDVLITALLHDAHKAYIGDIIKPMSELLDFVQPVKRLKTRIQNCIYAGLSSDISPKPMKRFVPYNGDLVQIADDWARVYESYHLQHSKGRSWTNPVEILQEEEMYRNIIIWDNEHAYTVFLRKYKELIT